MQPKVVTYSSYAFQKSTRFCNVDKVLAKMNQVAQPTLKINDLGRDLMRYPGDMSTMPKKCRNKIPLQRPDRFGDVIHFDIVYGSRTSIGGYHYVLWFVDRHSKHIEQYPIKYLASDELLKAMSLFRRDMGGCYPDKIIGDRDFKLIGGQVATSLKGINEDTEEKDQSVVTGSTEGLHNQNSLPKIKRRHFMTMFCNCLTRNYLPWKF